MAKRTQPTFITELTSNLGPSSGFLQVILGPRQVGKTTGILSFIERQKQASLYFSADDELSPTATWVEERWQEALIKGPDCLLVLDEIQKIPDWSGVVKKLWDRQKRAKTSAIRLVLLGSSSLHIQRGLSESLAGRFQLIRAHHWNLPKSRGLIDLSVADFVRYGGYPGSYSLLPHPDRWRNYVRDSIVESVIGKDILQIARVAKPALFRQAFTILMSYPAQEISYTKLLGQLQDCGNTDLIKHYIELYEGAYLLKALQKFSGKAVLSRSSSPKLIPLCGALIDREVFETRDGYGRAVEAAVGACLINHGLDVTYWRQGNDEVDFVTKHRGTLFAIEVKSGRKRTTKGMTEFLALHPRAVPVYVSEGTLDAFLENPDKVLTALA